MRILRKMKSKTFVAFWKSVRAVRFHQQALSVGDRMVSAFVQDLKNCRERSIRMSQTNELTPKQAAECRLNYPPGTRILLEHMDDKFAVPDGTRGTVDHVDDAGQIHMRWDNGRTLAIIPQVDSFRKLTKEELTQEQNMVIKVRGMEEMRL